MFFWADKSIFGNDFAKIRTIEGAPMRKIVQFVQKLEICIKVEEMDGEFYFRERIPMPKFFYLCPLFKNPCDGWG